MWKIDRDYSHAERERGVQIRFILLLSMASCLSIYKFRVNTWEITTHASGWALLTVISCICVTCEISLFSLLNTSPICSAVLPDSFKLFCQGLIEFSTLMITVSLVDLQGRKCVPSSASVHVRDSWSWRSWFPCLRVKSGRGNWCLQQQKHLQGASSDAAEAAGVSLGNLPS